MFSSSTMPEYRILYFHSEVIRDEMDSKLPVTEVRWRNNRCSTLAITINPCSPCPKRDSWLLIIAVGLSIGMGHMRPMVMMEISRLHCLHGPNIWWPSQGVPMIMVCRTIHCSLRDMGAWRWCQWWKRMQVCHIRARMSCPWCSRYSYLLRKHMLSHEVMNCTWPILNIFNMISILQIVQFKLELTSNWRWWFSFPDRKRERVSEKHSFFQYR